MSYVVALKPSNTELNQIQIRTECRVGKSQDQDRSLCAAASYRGILGNVGYVTLPLTNIFGREPPGLFLHNGVLPTTLRRGYVGSDELFISDRLLGHQGKLAIMGVSTSLTLASSTNLYMRVAHQMAGNIVGTDTVT